jgi:hypothetical protein
MKLRVRWSTPAERVLKNIPRRDAERVDAAVLRFAETAQGTIERLPTEPDVTVRLLVLGYVAVLTLDQSDGTLWVGWLYRRDR